MTQPHQIDREAVAALVEKLRAIESSMRFGATTAVTTNWYRNPEGPEAADLIERLAAPMEAVAWREKVARDCLFWRDGEEMKLSVKQAIATEVDWLAGEIGAAERGKATTRKTRKQYVKGEAVNRIGYAILQALAVIPTQGGEG